MKAELSAFKESEEFKGEDIRKLWHKKDRDSEYESNERKERDRELFKKARIRVKGRQTPAFQSQFTFRPGAHI